MRPIFKEVVLEGLMVAVAAGLIRISERLLSMAAQTPVEGQPLGPGPHALSRLQDPARRGPNSSGLDIRPRAPDGAMLRKALRLVVVMTYRSTH
jgi:hypothetical protein